MNIVNCERRFRQLGEARYLLEVRDLGVTLDVDRLRRDRYGALRGELTVRCVLAGARTVEGVLSSADFNLSDSRARQDLARFLAPRARASGLDWLGLLEELCLRVREAERTGHPAVLLRDLPRPSPGDEFDVDGLRLLKGHPSMLFGDGGAAKSYLALYLAGRLDQSGVRVGLFDWELSGEDHRDRLERLFGPRMPGVYYARCARPLVYEVDRLARMVLELRLQYAIFDSVAFACDGPPEAAEIAAGYFRAIRAIGVGSLHIAHVSKAEHADQRPFGSTFWHNGARATWNAKLADTSSDGQTINIGLFQRKANLGPIRPAVGFRVTFGEKTTTFARVNLAEVDGLADKLTIFERVQHVLKSGALTIAQLAEELGAKPDTIEKTVKRWEKKGRLIRLPGPDGIYRVGLIDRVRVH